MWLLSEQEKNYAGAFGMCECYQGEEFIAKETFVSNIDCIFWCINNMSRYYKVDDF